MRLLLLLSLFLFSGCATLENITKPEDAKSSETKAAGLSARVLAAGECGLYVWTADAAKTFTLFADDMATVLNKDGNEIALFEKSPTLPPATAREFLDENGKVYSLTLLSPQQIDGGIRYKTGRLTTLDDEGWERVTPIVGLYACQPAI